MFNQATTAAANSSDNNRDSVDWDKFETEMKRLSLMTSEKVFLEAGFSQAQVEQFHLDNACATRVSMALTAAGAPISSGGFNPAGTRVITSVHAMERYLTNTYGGADITWNNSNSLSSNIGGSRRGIVMYRHPSGGAAMNHVTAWQSGANVAIDGWYQESPSGTTSSFWGF